MDVLESGRTDWKAFHYADDAENFDTNFLLNPDDETQYSASGLCLDDGSDVYISGDVEAGSQILCSDYGTYHLDFAFDDAETDTKSLTLSQYDSLNNKINLDVGLDKTFRNISQVSVGGYHTCTLTTSGTVKCWGRGDNGSLGHGKNSASSTPVDVHTSDTDSSPLSGIAAISSGSKYSCALTDSGTVKCWGRGEYGILGNGGTTNSNTPVDVHTSTTESDPLSGIIAISSEYNHSCVLTNAGTVKCWGRNNDGQLGNGSTTQSSAPVDVCAREKTAQEVSCPKLTGIVAVAAGGSATCALTDRATVKCWGNYTKLGTGSNTDSLYPVDVHTSATDNAPLSGVVAISEKASHTCALTKSGFVKCWGRGDGGKLGNGGTTTRFTPVDVCARARTGGESSCPKLSGIIAVATGVETTCALTNTGSVKCWGDGSFGRLGNGGTSSSLYPVDVHTSSDDSNALNGIINISAMSEHACALTNDGQVKCWGTNEYGQIGNGEDGVYVNSAPVDVISSSWGPIDPPTPSYGEDFYVDTQETSHTFSLPREMFHPRLRY